MGLEACAQHVIWLSAVHIPGKQNILADKEFGENRFDVEWKLGSQLFEHIITLWGTPSVELFASRLNYQLKPFVSWRADPEAMAMDVFSLGWREHYFYAFLPFHLLTGYFRKWNRTRAREKLKFGSPGCYVS